MEAEKGLKEGGGSQGSPALRAPEEGDKCRDTDCGGEYGFERVMNCSCHISPPCHGCAENPLVCLRCGDDSRDPFPTAARGQGK